MDLLNRLGKLFLCAFQKSANQGWLFIKEGKARLSRQVKKKLSPNAKISLSLVLVLSYGYLLATSSDWSGDHVEIGCIHVLTFLPTLQFLFSMYAKLILIKLLYCLSLYGWVRVALFSLFLFVFSYVFVTVLLDHTAIFCMDKATDFFVSRFESNIMTVEDNRVYVERIVKHPLSGKPKWLHQLVRYPMEDVQMNCTTHITGFPGGKPFLNQVEWRHNGVPLTTMTDRHSHVTEFTELPKDHLRLFEGGEFETLRAMGLSLYELRSTLSIHLLEESEFGSYTCHSLGKVNITLSCDEWKMKTGQSCQNIRQNKRNAKSGASKKNKCQPKEKPRSLGNQCTCSPEQKYFFQDMHTQHEEFRLIRMKNRQDQIVAPPSSILFFMTSYWHLSNDDDIQMDYTVNGVSFSDLCNDEVFHGCSALQRLLSPFITYDPDDAWWFLDYLPYLSHIHHIMGGGQSAVGHCLCENSFGRHNVTYLRRYYNRTSEQHELIEITHPHTLLVRPPKQNTSRFLANFFNYDPIHLLEIADYLPDYAYDLTLLRDLAVVSAMCLGITDAVMISLAIGIFVSVCYITCQMLAFVGVVSKRLFLEGSMGYLCTAKMTARRFHNNALAGEDGERVEVYLSHSDSEADLETVTKKVLPLLEGQLSLKVCFRERDIPPNELELAGLSRAIQKSKRFIVFLSKDFAQDECRKLEASMILESLFERLSPLEDLLVIKLDSCEMPRQWTDATVHDWTSSNLTIDDHLLRLVQWVTPQAERNGAMWCVHDVWMVVLPFLLLLLFILFR